MSPRIANEHRWRVALHAISLSLLMVSAVSSAQETQIVIQKFLFSPHELTVTSGTQVTWVNRDETVHSIADNKTIHSGGLDTNDRYSVTFIAPGKYVYFCTLHPQMTGIVTVVDHHRSVRPQKKMARG